MNALINLTIFSLPLYIFRLKLLGLPTNIFEIIFGIAFIVFLYDRIANQKTFFSIKTLQLPLLGLLVALIISFIISNDKADALGIIKSWFLVPFLLFYMLSSVVTVNNIKKYLIPIYLSGILVATWALLQKIGVITTLFYQAGDSGFTDYLVSNPRVFGPFESPNYLAMFLAPVFFLSLPIYFACRNKFERFLFYIAESFIILAILFTKSDAGILALIAGVAVFLYLCFNEVIKRKPSLNYLIALVAVIAVAVVVYKATGDSASNILRFKIYKYSFKVLSDHVLLGIGLTGFKYFILKAAVDDLNFLLYSAYALHPHNLYLAFWIYTGVLGLVSFIGLVYKTIRRALKANLRAVSFFLAALTAILVHGLLDTTYFKNDLSALFWIILAFILILVPKDEKSSK